MRFEMDQIEIQFNLLNDEGLLYYFEFVGKGSIMNA